MSNEVAHTPGPASVLLAERHPGFTAEQINLIKNQLMDPDATFDEMGLFLHQCTRTGLDPMAGQIHAIHRWDSRLGRKKMTIQVGIDGFRAIGQDTDEYDGQDGPYWCGPDGKWVDVWLSKDYPSAAKVTVFRKGCTQGFPGIATWDEYVQLTKQGEVTSMWKGRPSGQLGKCAESLALRKAYPQKLSGIYTPDEMAQADNPQRPAGVEVQQVPAAVPTDEVADARAAVQPDPPKRGDDARKMTSRIESTCEICHEKIERKVLIAFKRDDQGTGHAAHWDCYENQNGEAAPDPDSSLHDHAPELGNETGAELLAEARGGQPEPMPVSAEDDSGLPF